MYQCVRCGHRLIHHRIWSLLFWISMAGIIPAFLTYKWMALVCAIVGVGCARYLKDAPENWCPHCNADGRIWKIKRWPSP